MIFGSKKSPEERAAEDRAIRRLLGAAAADRPHEPSPFLLPRLRAAIESGAAARRAPHPFGVAALQLLPALAVLMAVLSGVTGYASWSATRDREAALTSVVATGGGDLLLAVAFLGGGATP